MKRISFRQMPGLAAIALIRVYQKSRILRAPSCRFYPSCSEYMARSIEASGFFKGGLSGLARLCKCHPFHPGGVDEVPVSMPVLEETAIETRG